MLTYTITGDSVAISDKIRSHIQKKFNGFERFMDDDDAREIFITAGKTTARERDNSIRVEVRFKLKDQDFFAVGEAAEVMQAVDGAKAELMREVTRSSAKRKTLLHRGARRLKAMIKGTKKDVQRLS